MRKVLFLILLGAVTSTHAAESWLLQLDRWGNSSFMTLYLQDDGESCPVRSMVIA